MKRQYIFLRAAAMLLPFIISAGYPAFSQKTKKALYVIADGIPADVIERLHLPHMAKIIEDGTYSRMYVGGGKGTYSETPTISAVGYNSLLTGTWVNKHNVPDNDIKDPNYHYQNIFRLLKDQYPDKKAAVYSSWTDNRTKLMGHALPEAGNLKVDFYADGFELDTTRFKHEKSRDFMHRIDEQVVSDAVKGIKDHGPDLTWVYLEYTDDMGHMYGDSPQLDKAVEMLDLQLGKIFDAINYREAHFDEDWLFMVTTDHGRSEKDGKGHGGQSDRQRDTWLITNYKPLNDYARYYHPAIVDIMPSIARFMGIDIPLDVEREIDGTPLIGPVSLAEVNAKYFQNHLDISWKALSAAGKLKVWLSTTNDFKLGKKDNYVMLAEVPLSEQHVLVDVKKYPSAFYKIVLEAPDNTVNKWISVSR